MKLDIFKNRYFSTAVVVLSAMLLAFISGANGGGALKLWPLFGAVNQTLAALTLVVITIYLKSRGGLKWLATGLPGVFMIVMTLWAAIMNQTEFGQNNNILLQVINIVIIILVALIVVEGFIAFLKTTGKEEEPVSVEV